jgi:hypothetical protein
MRVILTETRDFFLSAVDGVVSAIHAKGSSQTIASLGKIPVYPKWITCTWSLQQRNLEIVKFRFVRASETARSHLFMLTCSETDASYSYAKRTGVFFFTTNLKLFWGLTGL